MRLTVKMRGNALSQLDRMLDYTAKISGQPRLSREEWAGTVLRQKAGESAQLVARLAQDGSVTIGGTPPMPPVDIVQEELPKVPLESDPSGNFTFTVGEYLAERIPLIWAVQMVRMRKLHLPGDDDPGLASPGAWVGTFLSDKVVEGTAVVDMTMLQQEAAPRVDIVAELEKQRAARARSISESSDG